MRATACLLAFLLSGIAVAQDQDVILQAMRDELARSKSLKVQTSDPGSTAPYFIEYVVEDADMLAITASLGAFITQSHTTVRLPVVKVRVGNPAFDNTNDVFSDAYSGSRYDADRLPLDLNYGAIRQIFWLATDRAYKTALESIGRKRSALRDVNQAERFPDFSAAAPVQAIQPVPRPAIDAEKWKNLTVKLSGAFTSYPQVISSDLEFQCVHSANYLVNTEGSAIRTPEDLAFLRVRALAQAPDGMTLRDSEVFQATELQDLPSELELKRGVAVVADELTKLAAAPLATSYDGPVLLEPRASSQLFAQLLGDNLKVTRKPIAEGRRGGGYTPSELENKVGSRILPEWMDVVDDPGQTEWHGQHLVGHYEFDVEGVRAAPLNLIEKGVLKTFLLTRTPAFKGFETSNGRGRMPGRFGAAAPGFGNLFVRASQTVSSADLKQKLIGMIKQQNKPYGMLIRKLDFPSGMSIEDLRRVATAAAQSGSTHLSAVPLLAYRVYPDGREELVRGVRFRGVSTKSFRDIAGASDETYVLNFLDSTAPLALMGAGSFVVNSSVIAPGVLFEELELERVQEDLPKLPIVPPPTLGS